MYDRIVVGAGTRRQREKGIDDSPALHKADIDRISNHGAREDLVDLAVELAAPTLEWLVDNGFEFAPETPRVVYGHEPYGVARTYYGPDQGGNILSVLVKLLDAAVTRGEIELRLSADVVELVASEAAEVRCVRSSTRDGIMMSPEIGAAIAGRGTYLPTFGGLPSPDGSGQVRWSDRPLLIAAERPPHEIYVDRNGKRWVAEDEASIDVKEHALVDVPGMTFQSISKKKQIVLPG